MTPTEESALIIAAKARHESIRVAYNGLKPPAYGASAEVVAQHAAALRALADELCPPVAAEAAPAKRR